ncbi:hypothetical protein niasHS_015560 [Heterodera schachtii]|uniref:B30.2/SPRY domain-containing protein n=1 Tax=Heterodera schachtii TaxID=97005 RepID=A0ABD2I1D1_HETSC
MSSFTTCSSVDEFSPLQPVFPNLSPSEEMSVLIARIAELNRAKTIEPSVASSEASGQDGYAIFPNLSPSEEMSVLIARIAELYRAKTIEPSVASSEVFGQDGYGMNDDQFNLDEEEEDEQQEESKTPTKDVSADHLKAILERIGEIEKQQQQQTKAAEERFSQLQNDQKKILEKVSEIEKQTQKKVFLKFQENCWDAFACNKYIEIIGDKSLIVRHKRPSGLWYSVFAKYPIVLNKHLSDFFYYKISVQKKEKNWVMFGFAVKQQLNKLDGPIYCAKGTYAYENYGQIWINGKGKARNAQYSYDVGDIVGIGVNSATRQIIFTKNGLRLDTSGLVDPSFSDASEERFSQLQNDQKKLEKEQKQLQKENIVSEDHLKAILERIGEIEKQQQQQTKAFLQSQNDQKKILENILSEMEKQIQKKVLLKFQENCWDSFACHNELKIIGDKSLFVNYKGPSGWRSVFAKYPIVLNKHLSDFFYYKISVQKKEKNWPISFGFAVKQQTNLDRAIRCEIGTYAYENYGQIWINGEGKGTNAEYSYSVGDTVGIGVHLTSRQMIFTKNGLRLDTSDFLVDPSFADGSLNPFVTLLSFGDKIEANFGPNFKFDLETL